MKLRQAWKMWTRDDNTIRFSRAMDTIATRTRRYYRNKAERFRKQGAITMAGYFAHKAEWPFLMADILFKEDGIKAGKSYRIW